MGKLAQTTSKYTVYAKFDADGTVEKPDVIGAVFGQTEGLLGQDLDLRELQRTGRIGRIDVDSRTIGGKTSGMIIIPSSLDASETALIAACIETIERVGPCNAKLHIDKIEDVRISKRKYVIERAKELLGSMFDEGTMEVQEITEQIKEAVRTSGIATYHGMPAGPNLDQYDSVIVVEGRADVINLLRCGVKNSIAVGGTSIPPELAEVTKRRETTVFVDGDRGGDLILKEISATCEVDFVARAPEGKEVEELTKKEIYKQLRERVPYVGEKPQFQSHPAPQVQRPKVEYRETTPGKENAAFVIREAEPVKTEPIREAPKINRVDVKQTEEFKKKLTSITGTRAAILLNDKYEAQGKLPLKEVFNALKEIDAYALIIDGNIEQGLINMCSKRGVKFLIGTGIKGRVKKPSNVTVLTADDLK